MKTPILVYVVPLCVPPKIAEPKETNLLHTLPVESSPVIYHLLSTLYSGHSWWVCWVVFGVVWNEERQVKEMSVCLLHSRTQQGKSQQRRVFLVFVFLIRFVRASIATEPNVKVKQSKKRPKTANDTTLDCTATFAPHSTHCSIRFLGCPVYVNEMRQKDK